jgi:hypothetical protein
MAPSFIGPTVPRNYPPLQSKFTPAALKIHKEAYSGLRAKVRYDDAMTKRLKGIGGIVLVAAIALQFTNPSHQNPPIVPGHDVLASNAPPPAVAAMLKNSCYNCHSSETKWPWYSYVAPVSWLMASDVNAARASLNFSDWPQDDPRRVRKRWRHIADAVQDGEMPLPKYARIHREARLDDQQRAELVKWAQEQSEQ